jgi:hypothetical protein
MSSNVKTVKIETLKFVSKDIEKHIFYRCQTTNNWLDASRDRYYDFAEKQNPQKR